MSVCVSICKDILNKSLLPPVNLRRIMHMTKPIARLVVFGSSEMVGRHLFAYML